MNFYNNTLNKPSVKSYINLFFLNNMSGVKFNNTNNPIFFLNSKILKIKQLKLHIANFFITNIVFINVVLLVFVF